MTPPPGDVNEKKYPCQKCGTLRTKAEGGTTFTVCDECWDVRDGDFTMAVNLTPANKERFKRSEVIVLVAEVIASTRRQAAKEVVESEVLETLLDYAVHQPDCILNRCEAGEPTEDGGYRTKYAGKWYQSKPVDETPKCNCGYTEAMTAFDKLKREVCGE